MCLALQAPRLLPPCSRTSRSRMMRVSWIFIPAQWTEPVVIGKAMRCSRGKSTWTFNHWAWSPAKRSVIARNLVRTALKCSRPFLRPKSRRLFEHSSLRSKVQNFSYCFRNAFFGVGAEDVMTMLDLIDDGAKLAAQCLVSRTPKSSEIRLAVQSPKADLAAAFENLMDREVALEDEVSAVLDLPDGVEARQVDLIALGAGELRPQDQCPVVELLLNDLGTKPVGGSLQCRDIVDG